MIIKKPSHCDFSKWEEFYKVSFSSVNNYNYLLKENELKNFGYNQLFLSNFKGVILFPFDSNDDQTVNRLMLEKYNPDLVYTHPGRGGAFGDSLGWASFISRLSEASGKCIKVTRLLNIVNNIKKNILKTNGTYQIVNEPVTAIVSRNAALGYREVYSKLFLPSKISWAGNVNKLVAVQFGKRGLEDRQIQNPLDEKKIINFLIKKGYTVKEMGGELGDEGCMKLAAECRFFVGTCSGMSHLCHSVGTPVHMLTNNRSLERVSAGHVKNTRSVFPTVFWQHPDHFVEYINNTL